MDSGFLNYLDGIFCVFPSALLPLVVTLYVRIFALGGRGDREGEALQGGIEGKL